MISEELKKDIKTPGNILEFSDGTKFLVTPGLAVSIGENFTDDCFGIKGEDIEITDDDEDAFLNFNTLKIENAQKSYDESINSCISSFFHGKIEKIYKPINYNVEKILEGEKITLNEKGIMFDLNMED